MYFFIRNRVKSVPGLFHLTIKDDCRGLTLVVIPSMRERGVYWAMFHTSKEGGGKNGIGQKLGKLVNSALTEYVKLTGKDGALEQHDKYNYHQTNKARVMGFI